MDYIAFGSGDRHVIMIPGLGEGLQSSARNLEGLHSFALPDGAVFGQQTLRKDLRQGLPLFRDGSFD